MEEIEMFQNYNDIVTVTDLMDMLHIGKNKAYELLNNGKIKSIRIGRVHKIPKIYVIQYLKNEAEDH